MPEAAIATPELECPAPLSTDKPTGRTNGHAVVLAAGVILAHLPLFVWHLRSLWLYRPHYQFYPLLLAGVGGLAWKSWPQFSAQTPPSWWSNLLLAFGLLTLSASVLLFSPWLAAVATMLSVGGLIGRYAVSGQWRDWLPVWSVMWLIVTHVSRVDLLCFFSRKSWLPNGQRLRKIICHPFTAFKGFGEPANVVIDCTPNCS